ncbi:hypothetical protein CspeluHIS016_0308900 [Cutaneotrichosporon spelunceum]|uniref:Uncharacterized protein n=1 Tax=Cutaneotrichosporon spelunceum TaxID=1672016 RepID=A0AAD3YBH4_9TREE|nr:hypothetical protein CspeluHIS016_0308900 [Cutaneotrichosporon spelunceum]
MAPPCRWECFNRDFENVHISLEAQLDAMMYLELGGRLSLDQVRDLREHIALHWGHLEGVRGALIRNLELVREWFEISEELAAMMGEEGEEEQVEGEVEAGQDEDGENKEQEGEDGGQVGSGEEMVVDGESLAPEAHARASAE